MTGNRGRRDHFIPQGYLRGFIDPSREKEQQPLWYFDIPRRDWSQRSTREVAYGIGFYDYEPADAQENADSAFLEFENSYPKIRDELIANEFRNWKDHLDFLLRYIQMMRARSPLFFEQKSAELRNRQAFKVQEIQPTGGMTVVPYALPDKFVKNLSITEMRIEIEKGVAWLKDYHWALRYCGSTTNPFVVAEQAVVMFGSRGTLQEALQHSDTLLFLPLCWQACLIGSPRPFNIQTGKFGLKDMRRVHQGFRQSAEVFLVSPRRLRDM